MSRCALPLPRLHASSTDSLFFQLFDVVPQDKGAELTKALSIDRAHYFFTDISNPESVKIAMDAAVAKLPSKRLVGAVHGAGIALRVSICCTESESH